MFDRSGPTVRIDPHELANWNTKFWLASLLFWGVGDIGTTIVGYLYISGAAEANPLIASLLGIHGIGILFLIKGGFFGGFYLAWRVVPTPYHVGIPMGLASVGVAVTVWNLFVFVRAV